MMSVKVLKITGFGIAAVLGLVLLAAATIMLLVDPNDYRDEITAAVQKATGRELRIDGDLSLSLFPWLGISLGDTRLSNAGGFAEENFARVAAVDVSVKLLPLLQQRIEMKTLSLRGLRVSLSRTVEGRNNWDDLFAAPSGDANLSKSKPVATSSKASIATPMAGLAIGGLNIEDAQILWDDRQAGQRLEVKQFSLRTGAIAQDRPIDIQLHSQFAVADPALQATIALQGRLTVDAQAKRFRMDALDMSLDLQGEVLPVSSMSLRLTGSVDADIAQQQVQLAGLQFQTLGLAVKSNLQLQNIFAVPKVSGQVSVAEFSPRDVLNTLGIDLPKTTDATVLNKVAIKLDVDASPEALNISNLNFFVDDSRLTGNVQVSRFSQPAVRFDFTLDGIDVDRYLPPADTTVPVSPVSATAASSALPLHMLRGLDVKGELDIGKVKVANARMTNIQLKLDADKGLIRLAPLQADLYQGKYRGAIALDVRSNTPKISADEQLTTVHIGPLLKDMLGEEKVSGVATLAAKITATGMTPEAMTETLNGSARFSLNDGAAKGVNLGQMIREAYAKIKKKPAPEKTGKQTDFAEMSGSVNIRNGIVQNQDLRANSPALRVAGKGRVDLPKQRINYLLNASIVETDQGQGGKDISELKSLTIPIKITGTFDKPKFKLDVGSALKTKAKARLKKEKAKLKTQVRQKLKKKEAEAKKKLEEKLKNKLKGLFR